jgi:hypothetical protein
LTSICASFVSLNGLALPVTASGAPSTTAPKAGSTWISTLEGRFDTKGRPMRMSVTACVALCGRSSNSTRPPLSWMLFTEKRAGSSEGGCFRIISIRSPKL